MGKKFTGGNIITRNFETLTEARRWIFGDAQKVKTLTMPAIELKRMAGSAAFELSSAEIAEATAAIRKCRSAGITLHAAVDYAIKRMNLAERSKTLREVADFVIAYKRVKWRLAQTPKRNAFHLLQGLRGPRRTAGERDNP